MFATFAHVVTTGCDRVFNDKNADHTVHVYGTSIPVQSTTVRCDFGRLSVNVNDSIVSVWATIPVVPA